MPRTPPHQLFVTVLALLTTPFLLGVTASAASPTPARPAPTPSALATARLGWFVWPLAPPRPVLRPFEAPGSPYGPGHRGVDLGGAVDEPVLAAADGVVVFAGQLAGRGVVSVDHRDGLRTTYEPVAAAVRPGQHVTSGDVLGHLRPGHCPATPACLHWGVRRGQKYVDPLTLIPPPSGRVRLLPWQET